MAEHGRIAQFLHRQGATAVALAGKATASSRMLPGFLIVGGQRCGTTALYSKLIKHPSVIGPTLHKGVHYFDTNYERGLSWYQGHFPTRASARATKNKTGGRVITGEASPYYMFHPLAAERIARDLPDVKVITVLRDPIERAYSAYTHEKARGFEDEESFEIALRLEGERLRGEEARIRKDPTYVSRTHQHNAYVARGRYIEQLERLEQHVGRDQMLVLDFDVVFDDVAQTMRQLVRFLNLPEWAPEEIPQRNARPRSAMPPDIRMRLAEEFEEYDARLEQWWGRVPSWRS